MHMQYFTRPGLPKLAYVHTKGTGTLPPVMFLGGYRSDMTGTKATCLEEQCKKRGQEYLRFDYSGHGSSEGNFDEGTIGSWAKDAQDIFDHVLNKPAIIVGSSMGGWMSLLLMRARPGKIKGLIGIAAAPDFTQAIYDHLNAAQKQELEKTGIVHVPNDYSDMPYTFTKKFYDESLRHFLLHETHAVDFPVRLIQGKRDNDVPWQTAEAIKGKLSGPDIKIIYIEDGDHRLSRPQDLGLIDKAVTSLSP